MKYFEFLNVCEMQKAKCFLDSEPAEFKSKNNNTPLSIVSDSRLLHRLSDESVFVCVRGTRTDSHNILKDFLERSNCPQLLEAIVVEEKNADTPWIKKNFSKVLIVVKDSRKFLAECLAVENNSPHKKMELIGVTGTNGKTSITWYIREIFNNHQEFSTSNAASIGTLGVITRNSQIDSSHTSPDPEVFFRTLDDLQRAGTKYVACEVSSHAIDQHRLYPSQFKAAVFSSFSRDHLDYHKTLDNYLQCKFKLFSEMLAPGGLAVVHESIFFLQDELQDIVRVELCAMQRLVVYSAKNRLDRLTGRLSEWGVTPEAVFSVESIEKVSSLKGPQAVNKEDAIEIAKVEKYVDSNLVETCSLKIPSKGIVASLNYLAASIVISDLTNSNLSGFDKVAVRPVPGRFQTIEHQGRVFIIDYAHTPDGLTVALELCLLLRNEKRTGYQGEVWVAFGCGGERDQGKRPVMGEIAASLADRVVVTSDNPRGENQADIAAQIAGGFPNDFSRYLLIGDRRTAIATVVRESKAGDIVLIAGRGHEKTQEISGVKYPFNDLEVLREELATHEKANFHK